MEIDPLTTSPSRLNAASRGGRHRRNASNWSQRTGATRDPRARRRSPTRLRTKEPDKTPKMTRQAPTTTVKPLLPLGESRLAGEDGKLGKAKKKEADGDKWDITPDGGSASREGRQFIVANVGNNGKIYLRWVMSCAIRKPCDGFMGNRSWRGSRPGFLCYRADLCS